MRLGLVVSLLLWSLVCCVAVAPASAAPLKQLMQDSSRWEPDIAAFAREDAVALRAPGGVVFVGSSSIRLWGTLSTDFPKVGVINRGFGGSRIRDATYFADRLVSGAYAARAVVFYAGDNDLAEGRTPTQVRDDFVAFVERVHRSQPELKIAFVSIKPSPSRVAFLEAARDANKRVREYAESEPLVDYLDVFTPMLDGDGLPRRDLFLEDELHMNRKGYDVWVSVIGPWLRAP